MKGIIFGKKNNEEFTKLLYPVMNKLYKIAYSYLKNKERASDALQDSVLLAFEKIHTLKDIKSFNPWITSILVNRCKEILRRDNKFIFDEYEEGLNSNYICIKDDFSRIEKNMVLLNAIDKVSDKYKEVIKLKYFGDLTIKEIAIALNIPEGTVKSRLNYGLNLLREILGKEVV